MERRYVVSFSPSLSIAHYFFSLSISSYTHTHTHTYNQLTNNSKSQGAAALSEGIQKNTTLNEFTADFTLDEESFKSITSHIKPSKKGGKKKKGKKKKKKK